jgi:AcrR family transcriptional regulator
MQRKHSDDEARRAEIVKEAHREFRTNGFTAASIASIARGANVSTATIYRLIGGKNELFAAAMDDAVVDFENWLQLKPLSANPLEALVETLKTYADYIMRPTFRGESRAFIGELGRNTGLDSKQGKWARDAVRRKIGGYIESCVEAGVLTGNDINRMTYFAIAVVFDGCCTEALFQGDNHEAELTAQQYAEQAVEWLLKVFGSADRAR